MSTSLLRSIFLAFILVVFSGLANATDFFWKGNGASDNIDDNGNWWAGSSHPASGDNLYFDNTSGIKHWVYSNYGAGSYFNWFITKNGAGGIKLYGDNTYAFKFENYSDGSLLELSPSSAVSGSREIGNRIGYDLEINPVGTGGILVSCDKISMDNTTIARNLKVYGAQTLTIDGIIYEKNGSGATLQLLAGATVVLKGNSTFTGATTITSGNLRFNPSSTSASYSSQVVLDGGTLSTTNIATNTILTNSSTLQLNNSSSTIALGSNVHSLKFAASNALTWGSGNITITGWTGTARTSGTAGKLYVGTTASGLTASQLSKISFSGYTGTAMILPTGEIVPSPVNISGSTGANGSYTTLKAAFDAINSNTNQSGNNIIITIAGSTSETASAVLTGQATNAWTTLKIYPTVTGLTIYGTLAAPLIDLNGADNVTIDGRVNETGLYNDSTLTISNDSPTSTAGTSTIRLYDGALSNTLKFCKIKGSSTDAAGGVIFLSATAANTGNIIDNNNITCSYPYRPINVIYSGGAANTVTISNNNIYNFFNSAASSYGIYLNTSTAASTISGNSFYETASFAPFVSGTIVEYTAININSTATGFNVSGNYIGGSAANCSGYWTKTNEYINAFRGIKLNVGTGSPSIVQDNTIKGFIWSNLGFDPLSPYYTLCNYAYFLGIYAFAGDITVGSSGHPNLIGETSGTGSITLTNGASLSGFTGIWISGTGAITCESNNIGAITVANNDAARSTAFAGIFRDNTNASGTISNNSIGSITSNSINATSASTSGAQNVQAIWNHGVASTGLTISNNTIANLRNGTTNTTGTTEGVVNGIYNDVNAKLIISGNTIHDLTIANANTSLNAPVSGIVLTSSTLSLSTVTNNTVYNLSNTYATYAGYVSGIFFTGGSGANICSNNTIYGLSATGATVADAKIVALNYNAGIGANVTNANFIHSLTIPNSSTGTIYGIRVETGAATYSNNIINLGGSSNISQYGFYDTGAATYDSNLYFNTINIGGTVASGANKTYCLYSAASTNTRNFRNNIFSNTRSTTGGSSLHYAVSLSANTNLTSNYNDYYVSGTGGILGSLATVDKSTLALWKTATAQDGLSYSTPPLLVSPGSTTATDYKSLCGLTGIAGVGVGNDYNSVSRSVTVPTMGAWERDINLWTGANSSVYNNTANWSKGTVPISTDNIVFAVSPSNDCVLDGNYTVANVINQSIKKITIPTTRRLTVTNSITTDGNAGRIYIQASSGAVNGSLIFHNTVDNPVYATVEMFDKATIVNPLGSTTNASNYHWQYFGIPVKSMTPLGTLNGSYIRRWNHPTAAWQLLKNDSVMSSFKGYEIAQPATKTITYTGILENGNYSTTLDVKVGTTIAGQYLFANPYTAAIRIFDITYGAQIDNAVYLFNTGSSAELATNGGTYGDSTSVLPGQYIVCPKNTAGTGLIPGQIPSMGGFLIKDTNVGGDHTFGINYNSVIQANTSKQRAKKADTSAATIIDVKGTRYADRMWLFTNPNCTKAFDNGWDGRKELGLAFTPQLYAMEADGNYQVNSVNDINNTDLAFQAGEDTNYTLIFTHQNIENAYSALYLVDLVENKTTDISATGTEYNFTVTSTATPVKRFKIVTATGGTTENAKFKESGLRVFGVQNNLIVHNFGSTVGNLTLYDINGRIVQQSTVSPFGITTIPTNLPEGCYVVKAKTESMEVTEKVILNKLAK